MNGFQNTGPLLVETNDGRNFTLKEALVFEAKDGRIYRAPFGTTTDGLSTPSLTWPTIAPFGHMSADGSWKGWKSGILHDALYRGFAECRTPEGNWVKLDFFDQEQCDDLIADALESEGFEPLLRTAVFDALREFGEYAFKSDRNPTVG